MPFDWRSPRAHCLRKSSFAAAGPGDSQNSLATCQSLAVRAINESIRSVLSVRAEEESL